MTSAGKNRTYLVKDDVGSKAAARRTRQAEALRANLRKRKQQKRDRNDNDGREARQED